ncbi:MAG: prolipoprotein diacylglyceryl transferase [Oscillospiraceae bacterium]|nr:prolipoprotein diacylglyceryl transferase [Oscillospiraceae bacterium]
MHITTDSPIRFPGLFGDRAFTLSAKALDIGNGVYWYGILIALGLLLALWFCMARRGQYGLREDDVLDALLWGVPFGIVGARVYYVIFYLDLYKNADGSFNWGKAVAIWDGGLAIYGAVIAVFLVAWAVSRRRKFSFWALMDLVVMGLLIGQAVGRWGNFMNREAFGAETTLPWRMQLTTTTGTLVEVHPTFLYESLWNVIGLILIATVVSKARRFDGENTCFYLLWYGVGRFFIEGLRTDSLYLFNWRIFGQPVRVSQALSLVLILIALGMLVYNIAIRHRTKEELYVNVAASRAAADENEEEAEQAVAAPEQSEEQI